MLAIPARMPRYNVWATKWDQGGFGRSSRGDGKPRDLGTSIPRSSRPSTSRARSSARTSSTTATRCTPPASCARSWASDRRIRWRAGSARRGSGTGRRRTSTDRSTRRSRTRSSPSSAREGPPPHPRPPSRRGGLCASYGFPAAASRSVVCRCSRARESGETDPLRWASRSACRAPRLAVQTWARAGALSLTECPPRSSHSRRRHLRPWMPNTRSGVLWTTRNGDDSGSITRAHCVSHPTRLRGATLCVVGWAISAGTSPARARAAHGRGGVSRSGRRWRGPTACCARPRSPARWPRPTASCSRPLTEATPWANRRRPRGP